MRGRSDRGNRGPRGGPPGKGDKDRWQPKTKLGRLVLTGRIKTMEEIFLHAIPIKEPEIVDHLLGEKLKDDVMKIKPVQKQTRAGQRTRFKAVVAVGDLNAIKGAMIYAKLAILPVRRGYWGNKIGDPHTVPNTVTGKCGSIRMRLIPAPRGSGIVAGSVAKKLLAMAGFEDVFTSSIGHTKTTTNFLVATYKAIEATEQAGIVFIDEFDKIAEKNRGGGPDVSREGVQRDILPIVEGATVNTKYGPVKTDHILFIAAGAFHVSKPSDLIPELQGRFPINVELENQEWATYLANRNAGNFQIARAGWVGDYQDPNTFLDMFITGAGMNGGKYSNEEYDALIKQAASMQAGEERFAVLRQAEDILINQDQAIIPLYVYVSQGMIDTNKWGGWYNNTMDYHPVKNIYLK